MANHLRSAINLKCNLVAFDSAPLVHLIREVENGQILVGDTAILMRLLDDQWLKVRGISSEIGSTSKRDGPYVWEGKTEDGSESWATFVVQSARLTTAYISMSGVVFKLDTSPWTGSYFLCQRDPEFRGKRID